MSCDGCPLRGVSINTKVPGGGSNSPSIMLVGEAPGREEDELNQVFVGPVGVFLRECMASMEVDASDIYFTNIVKCRPPNNKLVGKYKKAVKHCKEYLLEEIERLSPTVIVPLGDTAMEALLGIRGIWKNHGRVIDRDGIPVVPTFHPSYVKFYNKSDQVFDLYSQDLYNAAVIAEGGTPEIIIPDVDYITEGVTNDDILLLLKADILSIDIETNTVSTHYCTISADADRGPRILSISFSWDEGVAMFVPWDEEHMPAIKAVLESDIPKVAHNWKFEYSWLVLKEGIAVSNIYMDTMLAHYLVDENSRHGLKELAYTYTDIGGYDVEMDVYIGDHPECDPKKSGSYANIPLRLLSKYNCGDVDATLRIARKLSKVMDDKLWSLHNNILVPAAEMLSRAELSGFELDIDMWDCLNNEYTAKVSEAIDDAMSIDEVRHFWKYYKESTKAKGDRVNLRSSKQVSLLMTEYFRFPVIRETDSGNPSWDSEVIDELLRMDRYKGNKFLPILKRVRSILQIQSNCLGTTPKQIAESVDARVHTNFILHFVVTGRLSSRNPNMQAIPRESTVGPLNVPSIKTMYISRYDGGNIVQADYSQIELRILAMLSGDKAFRRIFEEGLDPHASVGVNIYKMLEGKDIDIADLPKEWRDKGKTTNFAIVYGQTPEGMAKKLGCTDAEAKKMMSATMSTYSGIDDLLKGYRNDVIKNGYVESPFGRRRRLPIIEGMSRSDKNAALREAGNHPVQSAASDMTLYSAVLLDAEIRRLGMKSHIICLVHDSIILDTPSNETEKVCKMVGDIMRSLHKHFDWIDGSFPIEVDVEYGPSWGELNEYEA